MAGSYSDVRGRRAGRGGGAENSSTPPFKPIPAAADQIGVNKFAKFTRNPIVVPFAEADDGKIATYYGRWASVRGEVGPWSLPVSMRIAA